MNQLNKNPKIAYIFLQCSACFAHLLLDVFGGRPRPLHVPAGHGDPRASPEIEPMVTLPPIAKDTNVTCRVTQQVSDNI